MQRSSLFRFIATCGLLAAAFGAAPASASVVVLNFAGLNGDAEEGPLNYYNGGAGSLGSTGGANYGVAFGGDALSCSGQPGGTCNTAQIPGGTGANALFFLTGPGDVMNVAAGFTTGFSFFYAAPIYTGSVGVYSGLNGTGTLLATLDLPLTTNGTSVPGCSSTNYCPYTPIGITFAGTAESVLFSGTANYIAFGDITLGSSSAGGGGGPTGVPEPETVALLGLGMVAAAAGLRRRRTR